MSLGEVTDEVQDLPDRFLIYGPPGAGKTSLAAQWVDPVFLMTDDGLLTLIRRGLLPKTPYFPKVAETATEVRLAVNELIVKDHGHKTLVIDTVSGVEALFADECCQKKYGGSREKFDAFGGNSGYKSMLPEWSEFLERLQRLRESKGMGVVLLAHSFVRSEKNPEGADYGRFAPSLHKIVAEPTVAWVDACLFAQFETFVEADKGRPGKTLATGGSQRVLKCTRSAAWEAKNRLGLPDEVVMAQGPQAAYRDLTAAARRPGATGDAPKKEVTP